MFSTLEKMLGLLLKHKENDRMEKANAVPDALKFQLEERAFPNYPNASLKTHFSVLTYFF